MDPAENSKPETLKRIGKYEIVDVLGRGGMGVVYRGLDRHLARHVAIKTLTDGIDKSPDNLARFYDEGRKTARLQHPNIVTIYELGDDGGVPYIVMELVEGDPLDKIIASENSPPLVERLRIVEALCSALAYAHRNNVIHRDVKPANILVQADGTVKLLDFGIARLEEKRNQDLSLTRPGFIIGTIPYMAPERLKDKPLDGRSDIFAAGVVLYQLVCGHLPFAGEDLGLMQKILNEPFVPLSNYLSAFPPLLDSIIERALAKLPDDRYQAADEMAADLATTIAEIRQEEAQQLLPEARRLMEARDLAGARAVLQKLIKVQTTHNTEARELLAEVTRHITQRQRIERVQQIILQAQTLLSNNEFDKSLAVLADGQERYPDTRELLELREHVEKEKERQLLLADFLRQAESARFEGNYQAAMELSRKALTLDTTNAKAFSLLKTVSKEAKEAEELATVRELLAQARKELSVNRYAEATELLQKVETIDPHNLELQLLMGDARSGLERNQRQEAIAQLESQAESATDIDQLKQTANLIREAIVTMPTESRLVVLLGKIDRTIQEDENRRFVDEVVQSCRGLRPQQALALVQKARMRLSGNDRLLALEGLLLDRVKVQSVEERRENYHLRAREALSRGSYNEAALILESCQREGISTPETDSLLEYARHEESERRRQELLSRRVDHAQSLIDNSSFEEAIRYLEAALDEYQEPSLRVLLEQATNGRNALHTEIESAISAAARMVQSGLLTEAIDSFQGEQPLVRQSARVRASQSAIKDEQQQAIFRMIGRAYSVLDSDLRASDSTIRWVESAFGDSAYGNLVSSAFRKRALQSADRRIQELTSKGKVLLRKADRPGVDELITEGSRIVEFAGTASQSEWRNFIDQSAKQGVMARLRNAGLRR